MAQISARLTSGLTVEISNGRHEWRGDEPLDAGGSDAGPDPHELLLSSLAACTCITIAGYCRHKELPLKSITANFSFARVHAEDCADCDKPRKKQSKKIVGDVHIEGDFDDSQKQRLAQIVTRCPVNKLLTQGIEIDDNARFDS